MNRKFSLVILLSSLSAMSPLAWSLGVGDAKVGSALGSPLEATIPLTDTQGISAQNLSVSLADADGYRRAGLERSLLVDELALSIVPQSGGLSVRVQSSQAVRTPYLDLLVDIDGPDGVIQRQVTLLFDPPGFGTQSTTPALPNPQTVNSPAQDSVRQVEPAQTSRERAPGYVASGETLWSVAKRLRPDADISISQMMLALLDANPDAFPGGNINRLRAGYVLEVPSREQIASRSAGEAREQVQAQNDAYARGEPTPDIASSTTSQPAPDSGGAAATDKAAAKPAQDDAGAPTGAVQADEPSAQAAQAAAGAAASSSEGQPDSQRLTLLTDAQVSSEATADVSENSAQDQRLARLEAQLSQSRQSLAAMRDERDRAQAELASLREDVARLRANLAARQASSATQDERAGQGESAAPAASEPAATGFVDRYLAPLWAALGQVGRSLYGQLAGLGLLVLLAIWWLMRRRRAAAQAKATEEVSAAVTPSAGKPQSAKSGSTSERFAPDAREALMPRAEAVSEADIFMAYGRYEKAQALLEESLEAEPERHDLRLKLVKALVEQGHWQQAHEQAERLADDTDDARQAELERLMARERAVPTSSSDQASSAADDASGSQQSSSTDDAEASAPIDLAPVEPPETFRPPIEREPVAYDGKGRHARPAWQEAKEMDSERLSEALKKASRDKAESSSDTTGSEAADEPHGVTAEDATEVGHEAEVDREAEAGHEAVEEDVTDKPERKQAEFSDAEEAASEESEPSAQANDRVIEYRPPSLESETAAPEETLMQPSIEFPQSQSPASKDTVSSGNDETLSDDEEDTPALGEDAGSNLAELMRETDTYSRGSASSINEQELEIEEVAFEPLHLDNDQPADLPPEARGLLSDAEALLEKGEHDQAQALLARALEEGDGETREQASRLIAQHNL